VRLKAEYCTPYQHTVGSSAVTLETKPPHPTAQTGRQHLWTFGGKQVTLPIQTARILPSCHSENLRKDQQRPADTNNRGYNKATGKIGHKSFICLQHMNFVCEIKRYGIKAYNPYELAKD
jgi:hypothetical protein